MKLHFEKAFDKVNWRFLANVVNQKQFAKKWGSWIKAVRGVLNNPYSSMGGLKGEFLLLEV